jgi:hypothetical protein
VPKKVHILKDDFVAEQYAAGMVSSESVYQLILLLNTSFGLVLKLVNPVNPDISSGSISFAHALHDEEDSLKVHLIKNKNEGHILFKNLSSIDYILVFTGKSSISVYEKILQNSKSLKNLLLIMPIEIAKLKNLNKFIL